MSSIVLNRNDQDLIEVDFYQHGASHTETTLREELLDGQKSYHFCISNLSVPMRNCPIHPVSQVTELFRVQARSTDADTVDEPSVSKLAQTTFQILQDLTEDELNIVYLEEIANTLVAETDIDYRQLSILAEVDEDDFDWTDLADDLPATQSLIIQAYTDRGYPRYHQDYMVCQIGPQRPHYSVTSFVQTLMQQCELINREITRRGIDPDLFDFEDQDDRAVAPAVIADQGDVLEYLSMSLSCDGSLIITPRGKFFDYFVINFTAYGAVLLGLDLEGLHRTPTGRYMLGLTDGSFDKPLFNEDNDFNEPNNPQPNVSYIVHRPIFSTADQRVKISVGSHLPMLSNVLINNEQQSSERDIAEAFFETIVKSEVVMDGNAHTIKLSSNIYTGQCNMIKKHDPQHSWNKLISSYRLRYMRFFLYITYRDFAVSDGKFKLRKMPVTIDPEDYWNFTVRFVSDS